MYTYFIILYYIFYFILLYTCTVLYAFFWHVGGATSCPRLRPLFWQTVAQVPEETGLDNDNLLGNIHNMAVDMGG